MGSSDSFHTFVFSGSDMKPYTSYLFNSLPLRCAVARKAFPGTKSLLRLLASHCLHLAGIKKAKHSSDGWVLSLRLHFLFCCIFSCPVLPS